MEAPIKSETPLSRRGNCNLEIVAVGDSVEKSFASGQHVGGSPETVAPRTAAFVRTLGPTHGPPAQVLRHGESGKSQLDGTPEPIAFFFLASWTMREVLGCFGDVLVCVLMADGAPHVTQTRRRIWTGQLVKWHQGRHRSRPGEYGVFDDTSNIIQPSKTRIEQSLNLTSV